MDLQKQCAYQRVQQSGVAMRSRLTTALRLSLYSDKINDWKFRSRQFAPHQTDSSHGAVRLGRAHTESISAGLWLSSQRTTLAFASTPTSRRWC